MAATGNIPWIESMWLAVSRAAIRAQRPIAFSLMLASFIWAFFKGGDLVVAVIVPKDSLVPTDTIGQSAALTHNIAPDQVVQYLTEWLPDYYAKISTQYMARVQTFIIACAALATAVAASSHWWPRFKELPYCVLTEAGPGRLMQWQYRSDKWRAQVLDDARQNVSWLPGTSVRLLKPLGNGHLLGRFAVWWLGMFLAVATTLSLSGAMLAGSFMSSQLHQSMARQLQAAIRQAFADLPSSSRQQAAPPLRLMRLEELAGMTEGDRALTLSAVSASLALLAALVSVYLRYRRETVPILIKAPGRPVDTGRLAGWSYTFLRGEPNPQWAGRVRFGGIPWRRYVAAEFLEPTGAPTLLHRPFEPVD